jgi:4-amino-4-deoxy-L-arabinose transferase-like glycosyltransferase
LADAASTEAPRLSREGRLVLWLIFATGVLRLVTAGAMGLGMDESYTTAISRDLHLSYFDHPPLHQWIAHAAGEAFGYGRWVRLPFIALSAGSTWLMYRLGARLFGAAAGAWAALALNLTAFFGVAAATWVLPDGPLAFFELGAALTFARILFPLPGETERPWLLWPAAGLWIGLAALSKYQAVTVGLGLGLSVLSLPQGRSRMIHPAVLTAKLVALALIAPVIVWNAEHQWISFTFQAGRGVAHHFDPFGLIKALLGQAGLLTPWLAVPLVWAVARALRTKEPGAWFLLISAAPTIVLFNLLPLVGAKVLPHWPMPGWLLLFPLLGAALARSTMRWPARWAVASGAALAAIWALAVSDAATAWVLDAIPSLKTDPTAEAMDWRRLRVDLDRRGLLKPGTFVVAAEWNEAGKIDQAVGDAAPVLVFNGDPRQYAFREPSDHFLHHDALIIGRGPTVAQELSRIAPHFALLTPLEGVTVGRDDKAEIALTVIAAHDLTSPYPLPGWARPKVTP